MPFRRREALLGAPLNPSLTPAQRAGPLPVRGLDPLRPVWQVDVWHAAEGQALLPVRVLSAQLRKEHRRRPSADVHGSRGTHRGRGRPVAVHADRLGPPRTASTRRSIPSSRRQLTPTPSLPRSPVLGVSVDSSKSSSIASSPQSVQTWIQSWPPANQADSGGHLQRSGGTEFSNQSGPDSAQGRRRHGQGRIGLSNRLQAAWH